MNFTKLGSTDKWSELFVYNFNMQNLHKWKDHTTRILASKMNFVTTLVSFFNWRWLRLLVLRNQGVDFGVEHVAHTGDEPAAAVDEGHGALALDIKSKGVGSGCVGHGFFLDGEWAGEWCCGLIVS